MSLSTHWYRLIALGLPVTLLPGEAEVIRSLQTPAQLKPTLAPLTEWIQAVLKENPTGSNARLFEALAGWLLAIEEYYPTAYKKISGQAPEIRQFQSEMGQKNPGKVVKLKRLSIPALKEWIE